MIVVNQDDIYKELLNFAFIDNENGKNNLEEMFKSTIFYSKPNSEEYYQAMQVAVCWAGIVIGSSRCRKYDIEFDK